MQISIQGADQALRALRVLEPETAREVGREISSVGAGLAAAVRRSAPGQAPMSGWKQTNGARGSRSGSGWPGWSQIQATSRRRGMTALVTTSSTPGAIAVMFESAGIRGGRTNAGRQMIANLERSAKLVKTGGKRQYSGRLGRRILSEEYPQIIEDIRAAAEKAVNRVNKLMP